MVPANFYSSDRRYTDSASKSSAERCEVFPCVSLMTAMLFAASAGLICRCPPLRTISGATLLVPSRSIWDPPSGAVTKGLSRLTYSGPMPSPLQPARPPGHTRPAPDAQPHRILLLSAVGALDAEVAVSVAWCCAALDLDAAALAAAVRRRCA